MSYEQKLIEKALRERDRYPLEPAIAIDGGGTTNRDDFMSYHLYPNGEIARRIHIIDMPSLIPIGRRFVDNAFERFAKNDKRLFPPQITSRFVLGDVIPTITFETRFDPEKRETNGFNIGAVPDNVEICYEIQDEKEQIKSSSSA